MQGVVLDEAKKPIPYATVYGAPGKACSTMTIVASPQQIPLGSRGPIPKSATGFTGDFPIGLKPVPNLSTYQADGTVAVEYQLTNLGSKPLQMPIRADQGPLTDLNGPPDSQPGEGDWAAKGTPWKGSSGVSSIRARKTAAAFSWACPPTPFACPGDCVQSVRKTKPTTILNDISGFTPAIKPTTNHGLTLVSCGKAQREGH